MNKDQLTKFFLPISIIIITILIVFVGYSFFSTSTIDQVCVEKFSDFFSETEDINVQIEECKNKESKASNWNIVNTKYRRECLVHALSIKEFEECY